MVRTGNFSRSAASRELSQTLPRVRTSEVLGSDSCISLRPCSWANALDAPMMASIDVRCCGRLIGTNSCELK